MKTAVVILNWNGLQHLQHYLPSVVSTTPDADIVVADNGSTDGSVAWLKAEMPSIKLVLLDKNYGFADGYNKALREITNQYYLLLNSDVEVTAGWLAPLLTFMDSNKDVAACQPKLLNYKEKHLFEYAGGAGGFIDRYGYPFCRGRIFDTIEQDNGQYDSMCDLFWATGASLWATSITCVRRWRWGCSALRRLPSASRRKSPSEASTKNRSPASLPAMDFTMSDRAMSIANYSAFASGSVRISGSPSVIRMVFS